MLQPSGTLPDPALGRGCYPYLQHCLHILAALDLS